MGIPSFVESEHRPLVFALNGQRVELSSVDPATTLLSYIRSETPFKGTKRGCGEGKEILDTIPALWVYCFDETTQGIRVCLFICFDEEFVMVFVFRWLWSMCGNVGEVQPCHQRSQGKFR